MIVRRVRKETEALVESFGIPVHKLKEVRRKREEAKPTKEKEKIESTNRRTSPTHTRSSHAAQSNQVEASRKRKKNKSTRSYKVVSIDEEEETNSKVVREIKATGTQVVKLNKRKSFVKGEEAKKKAKVDKPSMSVDEVERSVVKDGNLNPIFDWYDTFDESGKKILEEATIKHMNVFNKVLVEIMFGFPPSLYNSLESRRLSALSEEKNLRKRFLTNLYLEMSIEEMDLFLEKDKKEFRRKTRVNKLMIGETDAVFNETKEILEEFLSRDKINIEKINTENVQENKEVNVEVNELEEEDVNEEIMIVLDPLELEYILTSPNKKNIETHVATKVPVEVLAKEKELHTEEIEIPKINLESKSKIEKEKGQEIRIEEVKESLLEQQVESDPELDESSINLSTLSPIQMMKVAKIAQDKASEKILKSHIEDSDLLKLASGVL